VRDVGKMSFIAPLRRLFETNSNLYSIYEARLCLNHSRSVLELVGHCYLANTIYKATMPWQSYAYGMIRRGAADLPNMYVLGLS